MEKIKLSHLKCQKYKVSKILFFLPTCDRERCGGIAKRNELVLATAVVDDNLHIVRYQRDVISANGDGGGGSICNLPVTS